MSGKNRSNRLRRWVIGGIAGTLTVVAWCDSGINSAGTGRVVTVAQAGVTPPIGSSVLSETPHPLLTPLATRPRNPRKFYQRKGTPIDIFIDDQDHPLSSQERQRIQEALEQLPTGSLIGLPSIYVTRDGMTNGFLSPLNGTDLVLSLEYTGEHTEGPFALHNAIVTAVSQYVYARRLTIQEREEWKKLADGLSLSEQELGAAFSTDYMAYALYSRQYIATAIPALAGNSAEGNALERVLFVASLFVEPAGPDTRLRYYKTYDTGATDIPWPPQIAVRDRIHMQVGPFFFLLNGNQITGWAFADNSRAESEMAQEGFRLPGSYRCFPKAIPIPQTTLDRIIRSNAQ